jgi:predicted DNA-binding transcriptional regulator AlpA
LTGWRISANIGTVSQSDNLIATPEVARILGWSIAKVKREAKNGGIPTVTKLGPNTGAYVFDRAVIEFFARQLELAS